MEALPWMPQNGRAHHGMLPYVVSSPIGEGLHTCTDSHLDVFARRNSATTVVLTPGRPASAPSGTKIDFIVMLTMLSELETEQMVWMDLLHWQMLRTWQTNCMPTTTVTTLDFEV